MVVDLYFLLQNIDMKRGLTFVQKSGLGTPEIIAI